MVIQESAEMYLETILILSQKQPYVRSTDVAEYMGYSKPSVSRAMGILEQSGHLVMDENKYLILTDSGRALAEKIYERHTVLTSMLIHLGVNPDTAAEDACKIEHVISDESFHAIKHHIHHAVPVNE